MERGVCSAAQFRASQDGRGIRGYAAVFNQPSDDLGGFTEKVMPGAFSRCLSTNPDVRALFNHDPSQLLGRTASGTLRLREDSFGLLFDCDLPDTQLGRDVREMVKRGDLSQCSFGFFVQGQRWPNDTTRELTDVDLLDVSPVTFPAYPQTSVSARQAAHWPDGVPVEVRSRTSTSRSRIVAPAMPAPAAPSVATRQFENWDDRLAHVNERLAKLGLSKGDNTVEMTKETRKAFLRFALAGPGRVYRDLTTVDSGADAVPQGWLPMMFNAMKLADELCNFDVVRHLETTTGDPTLLFGGDDTQNAATVVAEAASDSEVDPTALQSILLPSAATWDSGVVTCSMSFLQDAGLNVPNWLAQQFGIRLARGIGRSLVSVLESSAIEGATSASASQITYADLLNLRSSVDEAYRRSPKCFWLMSDSTLANIDSLVDSVGQPIIKPVYQNGRRMILGFPVAFSPSLPSVAANAQPVYFGDFSYFVYRTVLPGNRSSDNQQSGMLVRLWQTEGFVENLLVGFKSFLRASGALMGVFDDGSPAVSNSPVKYLQMAA